MKTLGAIGLSPKKQPNRLTAVARAARMAKARATRLARAALVDEQKAAVTGTVTGVTIPDETA